MSQITIAVDVSFAGDPLDVTSVRLADPTATFGVREADSLAIVVPAGTDVPNVGVGQYEFTFDDGGVVYEYYFEIVHTGVTYYLHRVSSLPASQSQLDFGRYTNSDALRRKFGHDNVDKWAKLDSFDDPIAVANRISDAVRWGEDYVDDMLRGGPYAVPIANPVPPAISDAATTMAAVKLYEARGLQDVDPEAGVPINRFSAHRMAVERVLARIKAGRVVLRTEQIGTRVPKVQELDSRSDSIRTPVST